MSEVKIKYGELVKAISMGARILAVAPCEDCNSPKSMRYGGTRRCFKCWESHIAPKKKTKKKDKSRE